MRPEILDSELTQPPPPPPPNPTPARSFIDDVEFFFSKERPGEVDYRSASRIGQSDGDANRKRIRALRKELDAKYKWKSVGF